MCCSIYLKWTDAGIIPVNQELIALTTPLSSSTQRVVSGRLFHMGEVSISVTKQILRKFPKFPEILGELSMHKRCVPGCFSSTHTWKPANDATLTKMGGRLGWYNWDVWRVKINLSCVRPSYLTIAKCQFSLCCMQWMWQYIFNWLRNGAEILPRAASGKK